MHVGSRAGNFAQRRRPERSFVATKLGDGVSSFVGRLTVHPDADVVEPAVAEIGSRMAGAAAGFIKEKLSSPAEPLRTTPTRLQP